MREQILILSEDAVFARLLQLELERLGLRVSVRCAWEDGASAQVAVVDLDSATVPPEGACGYCIGFSRLPALSADEDGRRCAMILRRPFRMSLLRREVLLQLGPCVSSAPSEEGGHSAHPTLFPEGLRCGGRSVALTPTEQRLFRLLSEAEGETVSREAAEGTLLSVGKGTLEVHLCDLRKKLRRIDAAARIEAVRGVGYRLIFAEKEEKT